MEPVNIKQGTFDKLGIPICSLGKTGLSGIEIFLGLIDPSFDIPVGQFLGLRILGDPQVFLLGCSLVFHTKAEFPFFQGHLKLPLQAQDAFDAAEFVINVDPGEILLRTEAAQNDSTYPFNFSVILSLVSGIAELDRAVKKNFAILASNYL
ncbi:MAG: hypothetical protein BWY49_00066 [Candidatus Omnitrophica bacterium ADurb.Bin314]|nr:MAG: hypothetical protein BWY49_00066 [Candidatus Omnitrophica bacterium ADurb.Bin314]